MAFADRLAFARKQKKIRQADLRKLVGTSGDIIGKYERNENTPSIDVAAKIADALGVTLDYLVKDGEYEYIDSETLKGFKSSKSLTLVKRITYMHLWMRSSPNIKWTIYNSSIDMLSQHLTTT